MQYLRMNATSSEISFSKGWLLWGPFVLKATVYSQWLEVRWLHPRVGAVWLRKDFLYSSYKIFLFRLLFNIPQAWLVDNIFITLKTSNDIHVKSYTFLFHRNFLVIEVWTILEQSIWVQRGGFSSEIKIYWLSVFVGSLLLYSVYQTGASILLHECLSCRIL